MAEWSNAAVLKTVDLHGSGGSNPSLSAKCGSKSKKRAVNETFTALFAFGRGDKSGRFGVVFTDKIGDDGNN